MIGLVIVTHGNLGAEFINVTEHVVGKQEHIEAISVSATDSIDSRRDDILTAIDLVDQGKGVIILTDMFGGTPSNLAISIMDQKPVEVLAGVNIPTLIKLVSIRGDMPMKKVVDEAKEAGRKYINVASQLLKNGG